MYDYYNYDDYLMHHGVKGMKWGVRRNRGLSGSIRDMQRNSANRSLSKIDAKRKQVNSELRELRGYDRNPTGLAKSRVSTAIRRNQIKSLEKTRNSLDSKAKANKEALKELDSIEKHQQAKQEQKQAAKANMTPEQQKASRRKTALKVGVAVAGTALAAYGAYKTSELIKNKAADRSYKSGKQIADKYLNEAVSMKWSDLGPVPKNSPEINSMNIGRYRNAMQYTDARTKQVGSSTAEALKYLRNKDGRADITIGANLNETYAKGYYGDFRRKY